MQSNFSLNTKRWGWLQKPKLTLIVTMATKITFNNNIIIFYFELRYRKSWKVIKWLLRENYQWHISKHKNQKIALKRPLLVRGFNKSRQPVNFGAYFPNHGQLLSILNFELLQLLLNRYLVLNLMPESRFQASRLLDEFYYILWYYNYYDVLLKPLNCSIVSPYHQCKQASSELPVAQVHLVPRKAHWRVHKFLEIN